MDPHATQDGLTNADSERVRTSASGVPLPPATDQYTAEFFSVATALLEAKALEVSARTAAGQVATLTTVATVETTEAANADSLRT
ncbi:hypothetical protein MycrhDRAFT_6959 [Mycolicibacterium rhodesiae JS60]|nr:hypothetical protein MycrhDRAFT_6959 [Mycolicibacterium rhodesiae JS60]